MPQDWISEAISRFIGAMELGQEGARWRGDYDPFRNPRPDEDQDGDDGPDVIRLNAPHDLKDFDPAVDWMHLPPPMSPLPIGWEGDMPDLSPLRLLAPRLSISFGQVQPWHGSVAWEPAWTVPLPPQLASVTVQHITLSDDDDLIWGDGSTLFDIALLRDVWDQLIGQAEAMSLPALPQLAGLGGIGSAFLDADQSLAWMAALQDLPDGSYGEGVLIHAFGGGLGESGVPSPIMVNGQVAEQMPLLREVLSEAWLKTLGLDQEEDSPDGPDPWQGLPPIPDALPSGHQIATGGNMLSNEVAIVTNGPDAAVIVVGGDLIRLDLISQVGLLIGGGNGATANSVADQLINAARLDKGFLSIDEVVVEQSGSNGDSLLPLYFQVTTLQGDLVFVNQVEQHIFASDFDRIEAVLTGASSQISMGGNLLFNAMTLQALSSHYDLIIIGGDMVSLNMIEQVSVLYDSDYLDGWTLASTSGGGNLLFNSASISHGPMDQAHALGGAMQADLAAMQAGGSLTLQALQDQVFAGHQALSVLYVTGDLIEQNIIRQTTHLGDSDQLVLLQDQIRDQLIEAGISVETGANLLINAAAIVDLGIESQIMVAGQTYSDAVIYQAGLMDQAAPPNGVKLTVDLASAALGDLAPAAVAFLAGDGADNGGGDGASDADAPAWAQVSAPVAEGMHVLLS